MCFWPKINIIENFLIICKRFWTIHQNLSHPIVIHATNGEKPGFGRQGKSKGRISSIEIDEIVFHISFISISVSCIVLSIWYWSFKFCIHFEDWFLFTFSGVLRSIFGKFLYNQYKHNSYVLYVSQHRQSLIHSAKMFFVYF